jgi:hypothetical protein
MACRKIFKQNSGYTLFVQNKGILHRLRQRLRKKQDSRSLDLRGTPTHACVCGSTLFLVRCMFEDKEISLWFTDAECALCGALVTVPTPVDEDYAQV